MNKRQITALIIGVLISLLSIMINPTIFPKDARNIEYNRQVRKRTDRIFIIYIPLASLTICGVSAYFMRGKIRKTKFHEKCHLE
jgi:hypothetical protein